MLGNKLGDFQGKVTGTRILAPDGPGPTVATSFEVSGAILGEQATFMGTYWSTVRPDGTLYGECPKQGLIISAAGDIGEWSGAGVGHFTGQGTAVSFRGAVYFHGASGKLAPLNGMAVLYEWEIDAQGNAKTPFIEWK